MTEDGMSENGMTEPTFVYVTYIKTTPEALWKALTTPEFTRQYWWDRAVESDWTVGAPIRYRYDDGAKLDIDGEILAIDPPWLLSYTFTDPHGRAREEQPSRVTFQIETYENSVRLTVTHDQFAPDGRQYKGVSNGWPGILSGLKTLLETGQPAAW